MTLTDRIPLMQPESTTRNVVVGIGYLLTSWIWVIFLPFITALFVWRNMYGWADALDGLPGISSGGGLIAGGVAFVYVFVIVSIVGAVAGGGGGNEGGDTQTVTDGGAATTPTPNNDTPDQTRAQTATLDSTQTAVSETTPTVTPTLTSTPTATLTPEPTPVGVNPDARTHLPSITTVDHYYDEGRTPLSGTGQSVTEPFEFEGGLMVLDYEHSGDSNFQVEIYDSDGERVDIPVNKIGSVDGTTAVALPAGEYSLDVNADDDWEIVIAQPLAPEEDIHAPPAASNGSEPTVVGPIRLEGSIVVTASHDGESNFQVFFYNEDANSDFERTTVFNEIGTIEDAQTRESHTGVAWVVVEADGDWELEFEE